MNLASVSGLHGGKQLELSIDLLDRPTGCSVVLKLKFDGDVGKIDLQIDFSESAPSLTLPSVQLTGVSICLAGCGLAASKPILDCLKKNKTIGGFKKCLKAKGLLIAATALECLLACLGGSLAAGTDA